MEKRCLIQKLFLVSLLVLFIPLTSAFSGSGSGTALSPFQITNCSELREIADYLGPAQSKYWILMNDIDCIETWNSSIWNWSGVTENGTGWGPVGPNSQWYGNFNGQGYTILNLYQNKTDGVPCGFINNNYATMYNFTITNSTFEYLEPWVSTSGMCSLAYRNYGTLSNINITSTNVTGHYYGAGAVWENYNIMNNVYFDGNIHIDATTSSLLYGSGLVVLNTGGGVINNSHSSGVLTSGTGKTGYCGGIVAQNGGNIYNSYTNMTVGCAAYTNANLRVGGFVGYNSGGSIFNSYATGLSYGAVSAGGLSTETARVGGFVGHNEANINESYSTGDAYLTAGQPGVDNLWVGGFVGDNDGIIWNSFARGDPTAQLSNRDAPNNVRVAGFAATGAGSTYNAYSTGDPACTTPAPPTTACTNGVFGFGSTGTRNIFYDNETSHEYGETGERTTAEMKNIRTFIDTLFSSGLILPVWDFEGISYNDSATDNIWDIDGISNDGYPFLIPTYTYPEIVLQFPSDGYYYYTDGEIGFIGYVNRNGHDINNITYHVTSGYTSYSDTDNYYFDWDSTGNSFNTFSDNSEITQYGDYFWITRFNTVVNQSESGVYKFFMNGTQTGDFFLTSPYGNNRPYGIETNGTFIWTTDYDIGDIVFEYDMDGNFIQNHTLFSLINNGSAGLTTDNNYFWIIDEDDRYIYEYEMNFTYRTFYTIPGAVQTVGITNDENYFWVTDINGLSSERLWKLYLNGTYIESIDIVITDGFSDGLRGITNNGTFFWLSTYLTNNIYEFYKINTTQDDPIYFSFTQSLPTNTYSWYADIYFDDIFHLTSTSNEFTKYPPIGFCGDGYCRSWEGEECSTCALDCGSCPPEGGGGGTGDTTPYTAFSTGQGNISATIGTPGLDSCWWSNRTNTQNYSIDCTQDVTFYITPIESSSGIYTLYLYWNDTSGNNFTRQIPYVISLEAPAITLNYPQTSTGVSTTNVGINFTASDVDGIANCSLWIDKTGSWALSQTNTSIINNTRTTFYETLSEGTYNYNVECYDIYENSSFAATNFTFTVDTHAPAISIVWFGIGNDTTTFNFNTSSSDANSYTCSYDIYNSTGDIDGPSNSNVSFICSSNPHTAYVTSYGSYTLITYATDIAGNVGSKSYPFFVTGEEQDNIIGGGGGGGGGGASIEEVEELLDIRGFCGDGICQDGSNNTFNRGEDFFTCSQDCGGIQNTFNFDTLNLETLLLNCFSSDEDLKEHCIWRTQPGLFIILVIIILFFVFTIFFSYKKKGKSSTRKIKYNPDFLKKIERDFKRRR